MTVKRSVSIRGHQTSISIEDAFWREFQGVATRTGTTVAALIARVDAERAAEVNLSSAIRLFVLADLQRQLTEERANAASGGRRDTTGEPHPIG